MPSRDPPDWTQIKEEKAIKHTFDVETGKWHQESCKVKLDTTHFARGSLRKAFYLQDIQDPSSIYVAKASIDPEENRSVYFQDVEMQMYAKKWATKFNSYNPPKSVDFVTSWIIILGERPGHPL